MEEIVGFLASIYPPEADAGPLFVTAGAPASAHLSDLIEEAGDAQHLLFDRVAEYAGADAFLAGERLGSHRGSQPRFRFPRQNLTSLIGMERRRFLEARSGSFRASPSLSHVAPIELRCEAPRETPRLVRRP